MELARCLEGDMAVRARSNQPLAPYTVGMSADRDELLRLVQELPDEQVRQALSDVRKHLRPASERPWPPAFFSSAPGDGISIAEQADELLREGFGR